MVGEIVSLAQLVIGWFLNIRIVISATGVPLLSKGPIMLISLLLYLHKRK